MKIHQVLEAARRKARSAFGRAETDVLVLALVFAALTIWSWRKWPDPLIDFGRELYTPWRLANGEVLYRDVASLFGPFSQYFNALWFRVFGVAFTTLIVGNLIVLALLACGIRYIVLTCCDRFTATAATLVTLLVFAFSQYSVAGNYNFVSPYSHEASHSIALAVGIMVALFHGIRSGRRLLFVVAGVQFGLLLLTRAETSVAMMVGLGLALSAWLAQGGGNGRLIVGRALLFLGSALIPLAAFFAYFRLHVPPTAALRAVAGAWWILLTTDATRGQFYLEWSGFDEPGANLLAMLKNFGGFLFFVATAWWLDRLWPRLNASGSAARRSAWWIAGIVLLVGCLVVVPWYRFPRALPMIVACGLVAFLVLFHRRRHGGEADVRLLLLLAWAGFALALQAKMLLMARVYHYGFYLGLPATVLLVVIVLWLVPTRIGGTGARGRVFRSLATLMLIAGVGVHLVVSVTLYGRKRHTVASGPDRFYAFDTPERWEGRTINAALSYIQENVAPDATMAVMPEGVMINYLARRENPTSFITFMPPELRAYGESRILQALAAAPPDYILLVSRDMSEYGVPAFGADARYGKAIMDWVVRHYRTIETFADRPIRDGGRGIEVMEHAVPVPAEDPRTPLRRRRRRSVRREVP